MREIIIDGKALPCRVTMGAFLRYRNATGKDAASITTGEDLMVFLYHCVASACSADKVPFEMEMMAFLDSINAEQLGEFAATFQDDAKKKAETQ